MPKLIKGERVGLCLTAEDIKALETLPDNTGTYTAAEFAEDTGRYMLAGLTAGDIEWLKGQTEAWHNQNKDEDTKL